MSDFVRRLLFRLQLAEGGQIQLVTFEQADDLSGQWQVVQPGRADERLFVVTANTDQHLAAIRVESFPKGLLKYRDQLEGRSLLVRKADRIDLECVVRGYMAGSFWKEYKAARGDNGQPVHLYDYHFPGDLLESQKLPEPIFTPATKEDTGHDQNISVTEAKKRFGVEAVDQLKRLSLAIFHKASGYAASKGIILVDTKFEFGYIAGKLSLIDEVLSPDSSRFWLASQYLPGQPQDLQDVV